MIRYSNWDAGGRVGCMMEAKEMQTIVAERIRRIELIRAKTDYIYKRTQDMLTALDNGVDKDECFEHWVKLFNEDTSGFSKEEKDYYLAQCSGLVNLISDFMKS